MVWCGSSLWSLLGKWAAYTRMLWHSVAVHSCHSLDWRHNPSHSLPLSRWLAVAKATGRASDGSESDEAGGEATKRRPAVLGAQPPPPPNPRDTHYEWSTFFTVEYSNSGSLSNQECHVQSEPCHANKGKFVHMKIPLRICLHDVRQWSPFRYWEKCTESLYHTGNKLETKARTGTRLVAGKGCLHTKTVINM